MADPKITIRVEGSGLPGGGSDGQVLTRKDGKAAWGDAPKGFSGSWNDLSDKPFGMIAELVTVLDSTEIFVEDRGDYGIYGYVMGESGEFDEPSPGDRCVVTLDGVVYDCVATTGQEGGTFADEVIVGDEDYTQYPFCLSWFNNDSQSRIYLHMPAQEYHTLSVQMEQENVKTLDPKFIPEGFSGSWNDLTDKPAVKAGSASLAVSLNLGAASGQNALAEGNLTKASGNAAHAEGVQSQATNTGAHAEGNSTASGQCSHAEGSSTASGQYAHSEGAVTQATSYGSHSEGEYTVAKANVSHAEGAYCKASSYAQHVQGTYNVEDTKGKYAHIVGNGSASALSNAHTIDWAGLGWFAGGLKVGGTGQDNAAAVEVAVKTDIPEDIVVEWDVDTMDSTGMPAPSCTVSYDDFVIGVQSGKKVVGVARFGGEIAMRGYAIAINGALAEGVEGWLIEFEHRSLRLAAHYKPDGTILHHV